MPAVDEVLNIAAYLFVSLNDTAGLRESIRSQAESHALKGTVLLAEEGINLCLAGAPPAVQAFVRWLRSDARFAALTTKDSASNSQPFARLRVNVKREIIRMDRPSIRPQARRAPAVDARTLARWLDQGHDDSGRELLMLDTRNAFEVDQGRFAGAVDWRLSRFSEFPDALLRHRDALRGKTVVSYCTGGIRCEKAAIFMAEAGVENVLQLDGGILRYCEDTGGAFFDGQCFVFDRRIALDAELHASG